MAEVILDAGPLVAILNRRDLYHEWAQESLRSLSHPLLTCDAVLTETLFLISPAPQTRQQLRLYLERGLIVSRFNSQANASRIFDLMESYRNVPMSFADACLVCMVENHSGSSIFTLDRDFTIYRQPKRRVIPLIAPFQI